MITTVDDDARLPSPEMCVAFIALSERSPVKLLVAFNRDEDYARPTRAARVWDDGELELANGHHDDDGDDCDGDGGATARSVRIVGCRDEKCGGTWLALCASTGKWALLTNACGSGQTGASSSSSGGGGGGAAGIESVMTIEIMFSDIVGLDHVNHLLLNSRLTLETRLSTTRTFGTLSDAVRFHGAALRRRTGALDFEYPKRWDGVSLSEEREAKRQVLGSKRARDGDDARFALGDSSSEDSEEDEVDAPTTSSAIVEPIRVNVLRGYKTFVTTFDDIELQPALQSVIEPHKRLLTLFETGLPLWAILGPQFGICLPQRPLVRKGLKVAFLALTLMSVVAGLHELQENLPGTPLAKWPRFARVVDSEPSVKVASSIYTQSIILAPFYSAIRAASFGIFRLAMSIARGLVIPAMRVGFALLSGNSLARTFSTAFGSANGFVNVWKGAILLLARSSQGLVKLIVYIADRIFVHRKSLRLRAEELAGVTPQRSAFVSPMRSRAVETRLVSQIVEDEDEYDDIDDVDAKKND